MNLLWTARLRTFSLRRMTFGLSALAAFIIIAVMVWLCVSSHLEGAPKADAKTFSRTDNAGKGEGRTQPSFRKTYDMRARTMG